MTKVVGPEHVNLFNAISSARSKRLAKILIEILQQPPEHGEPLKEKLLLEQGQ
jgi:hypothetical protein